ncbi:protein NRT1/ PTR FAMILY 2.8-like [Neltuma alba]|uniref:protein NRT1/ PTR FAMILY 2.8-like n=1 Tax=Neltuma alba TaxID=207710 RepID=UPI0010A498FE|nr:protein NRT1/ PTR FAMILY 2.8-like [Prosopis alba]
MEMVTDNPSSFSLILEDREQNFAPPTPATSRRAGGWRSVRYILANESFEKLASMSLILNITLYLRSNYNMNNIAVVNVVQIWVGSSNMASIAGALITDTYLGRFRALLYGSIASLLGMLTITLTAGIHQLRPPTCTDPLHCQKSKAWQIGILFGGLGLLSIGAGGIRPCNIAFGADQFDTKTEKGRAQLESFFNWWYLSFTVALVIALTGVVYVQTNISWTIGFAIPTVCLALSAFIFLLGRNTYIYKKPQGSIFVDMAKVVVTAFRKYKLQPSGKSFYDPTHTLDESPLDNKGHAYKDRCKCLDKAAIIANPSTELDDQGMSRNGWRLCSLEQVQNFKCLLGILPVWVAGICCFMVINQQNTFGILQVMQMDRSIGPHFKIPPGWMNLTAMLSLSIWIQVYEGIYIPLSRKFYKNAVRLSMGLRIKIGILLSILCMLVAATVEKQRRHSALRQNSYISPTRFTLLLPQYALSGLTEAFAAVAIMEFFTMQLPESMRTVSGALFFLSMSIAEYLGSLIVNIVDKLTSENGRKPWLGHHDLNHVRLENYYYIIAALGALNFLYFSFFAVHYLTSTQGTEMKEVQPQNSTACRNGELSGPEDEEKGLSIKRS